MKVKAIVWEEYEDEGGKKRKRAVHAELEYEELTDAQKRSYELSKKSEDIRKDAEERKKNNVVKEKK